MGEEPDLVILWPQLPREMSQEVWDMYLALSRLVCLEVAFSLISRSVGS